MKRLKQSPPTTKTTQFDVIKKVYIKYPGLEGMCQVRGVGTGVYRKEFDCHGDAEMITSYLLPFGIPAEDRR